MFADLLLDKSSGWAAKPVRFHITAYTATMPTPTLRPEKPLRYFPDPVIKPFRDQRLSQPGSRPQSRAQS